MILIVLAILIVVVLACYASWLWFQVVQKHKQEKQALLKIAQEKQLAEIKHQNYLQTSLHVIAQSYIKGELNISEACIRVKVLLDNLTIDGVDKSQFSIFDEVYEKLQDFDTHQARNELSEKERKTQDRKRHFIEMKNKEALEIAFSKVADQFEIIKE